MRCKSIGSILAFCLVFGIGMSTPSTAAESDDPSAPGLTLRYLGEMATHPGASVGLEAYLYDGSVTDVILAPNIGWYVHPQNHHAGFVNVEIGGRWTTSGGFFVDTFFGLGYMQRFPDGQLYSVDQQGEVRRRTNDGSAAALGTAMLGIGWDLSKNDLAPMNLHFRVGSFGEFPYNQTLLPHPVAQAGLTFQFGP